MYSQFDRFTVRKGDSSTGCYKPDTVGSDIGHIVDAKTESDVPTMVQVMALTGGPDLRVDLYNRRPEDTRGYAIRTKDWFGDKTLTVVDLEPEQDF